MGSVWDAIARRERVPSLRGAVRRDRLRVLPYLHSTFGADSALYRFFLWFGFPFGLLGLDVLMFLEPFGPLAAIRTPNPPPTRPQSAPNPPLIRP